MPTYRNLWNSTQQLARRHAQEQNSNDLGVADVDPTIRRPWSYANPYQLGRPRDASYAAIGQVREWQNSLRTSVDLGTTDYDPTLVRPNIAPYPYQQKFRRLEGAYAAVRSFRLNQLTGNDLGSADADATIRQPWSESNPYQLRWRDPTASVVAANRAWTLDRLTSNDLGTTDFDPTIKPNWQASNPYQIRYRDPTVGVVEGNRAWFLYRLTSVDLGLADYDPTVRPLFQAANPYQLRLAPNDLPAVGATLARLRQVAPAQEDVFVPTHMLWTAANPHHLRWRDPTVGLVEAMRAWMIRRRIAIGTVEGDGTVTLVTIGRGDATAAFTTRGAGQAARPSSSGRGGVRVTQPEGSVSLTNTGRGVAQVEGTET